MTLTRFVVLANSWKHQDWCLAGIDLETGKWVRPVTELEDGRVPKARMDLDGHFPALLDVLEAPLDTTGPDFGFECENRTILSGKWRRVGRLTPQDVLKYATQPDLVLHNEKKYVSVGELRRKPFHQRTTLQLIKVDDFRVRDARKTDTTKPNWVGVIMSGEKELEVKITDPVYSNKLNRGWKAARECLLTMSLGMPYKPPEWGEKGKPVCWKLIAGILELRERHSIAALFSRARAFIQGTG